MLIIRELSSLNRAKLQKANKGDLNGRIKTLQKEVNLLLEDDNVKWKQREKHKWLKMGDRNTRFYHLCASQRRKINAIQLVKMRVERWQ